MAAFYPFSSFFSQSHFGRWEDIFDFYRPPSPYQNPVVNTWDEGRRESGQKDHRQSPQRASTPADQKYTHMHDEEHEVRKKLSQIEIYEPSFASPSTPPPSPESKHHKSLLKKLTNKLTFKEKLLEKALNVETLNIPEHQRIVIEPSDRLYLPNLKIISWHYDSAPGDEFYYKDGNIQRRNEMESKKRQALHRILMAAPNLSCIKDFNFDKDFDLVISVGKVHCIHQLCLHDQVNADHLLEFVEARPRLSVLRLLVNRPGHQHYDLDRRWKIGLSLKFLIFSSFDTLKILDLTQFCTYYDIQVPHPLPNLYQLTIGNVDADGTTRPSRVLPRKIRLQEKFPNLRVLDCSRLVSDNNEYWDQYFPDWERHVGKFESVKVLMISDDLTHYFMEKIQKELCPNVVKLVVYSHGHDNSLDFMMVKIFRYWQQLEALEIRIRDFPAEHSFSLDPTLTGLHEDTCRKLRRIGPGRASRQFDHDVTEMQATSPAYTSIASLTKLKTLEVILGHDCLRKFAHPDPDEEFCPLMSFVSDRYGFSHTPNLNVVITFDQECPWGIEIMKRFHSIINPYVILRHKHDRCCCKAAGA